jgi:hypothetical protein
MLEQRHRDRGDQPWPRADDGTVKRGTGDTADPALARHSGQLETYARHDGGFSLQL